MLQDGALWSYLCLRSPRQCQLRRLKRLNRPQLRLNRKSLLTFLQNEVDYLLNGRRNVSVNPFLERRITWVQVVVVVPQVVSVVLLVPQVVSGVLLVPLLVSGVPRVLRLVLGPSKRGNRIKPILNRLAFFLTRRTGRLPR